MRIRTIRIPDGNRFLLQVGLLSHFCLLISGSHLSFLVGELEIRFITTASELDSFPLKKKSNNVVILIKYSVILVLLSEMCIVLLHYLN